MQKKRAFLAVLVIVILVGIIAAVSGLTGRGGIDAGVMGDKVGIVEINGIIKDSDEILRQIADFGQDGRIKAIIIRIDSPGGAVGPSQEIYSEILKVKKKKTVVASIGTLGASGGYYIASAATKIVANPGSITGSIGVVIQFFNFHQLLGKIGVKGNVIKSGEYKDVGSPLRDMTPEERQIMQSVIDDVHTQFVEAVAKARNLKKEDVARIADGRIITGRHAKDLKLVDELGNFNDAVELTKKTADIKGEPKLVYARKKKSALRELLSGFTEGDSKTRLLMLLSDIRIPFYISNVINWAGHE